MQDSSSSFYGPVGIRSGCTAALGLLFSPCRITTYRFCRNIPGMALHVCNFFLLVFCNGMQYIADLNLNGIVGSIPAQGMDVFSGRGLCDKLVPRPEESYRVWCV
jgi:hypothetical protein